MDTDTAALALTVGRSVARRSRRDDRAAAESDAVLGAWQASQRWDPEGGISLRGWMSHRAAGAVLDGYRARHGRIPRPSEVPLYDDIDGDAVPLVLPDRRADADMQRVEVADLLAHLVAAEAEVMRLVLDGFTDAEIAALTGRCSLTVRGLRTAAAERLRQVVPAPAGWTGEAGCKGCGGEIEQPAAGRRRRWCLACRPPKS